MRFRKKIIKKKQNKKNSVIYTPSLFAVVDSTVNIEWCRYDGLKFEITKRQKNISPTGQVRMSRESKKENIVQNKKKMRFRKNETQKK